MQFKKFIPGSSAKLQRMLEVLPSSLRLLSPRFAEREKVSQCLFFQSRSYCNGQNETAIWLGLKLSCLQTRGHKHSFNK